MLVDSRRLMALLFAVGLAAIGMGGVASEGDARRETALPQRVLFVGNSFTYYNDSLHKHVGNFLRASGSYQANSLRLRAMTMSGARLAEHAGGIAAMVRSGNWDAVVMHGHSTAMLNEENRRSFVAAAVEHSDYLRENGAEPVFLMTWAYKHEPQMLPLIESGYRDIGRQLKAPVIPVGLAFAHINDEYPEVDLYEADIRAFGPTGEVLYKRETKHPSAAGTYLAAAVVVAALFGESPENSWYTAGLDPDLARLLQRVAVATVAGYR